MADLYTRMRGTASRLLADYKQGTIIYHHPGTPGGTPQAPTPGTPSDHTLDATATGVAQKYLFAGDGKFVATDKQITAAVFGVTPIESGTVTIDGQNLQIIQIDPIPAAGTTVAWRIFCRA